MFEVMLVRCSHQPSLTRQVLAKLTTSQPFVRRIDLSLAALLALSLALSALSATVVAHGAEATQQHWAFQAPVRPPLPPVRQQRWVRNPIDTFVLARLEAQRMEPAPQADRVTLLRRLSLDLTGLPPTIDAVDAFLGSDSVASYDAAVERLLSSAHYGERWGRHWLDAARYADSDGFEKDRPRFVWFYRDWVVDAFNRDLPYDRFIIEQVAGDLLPNATQRERVATGFLRNSMNNEEGGTDPEQFRMEALFDRVDAIGKSILGLTIQCGQCHDHKYDPLTQEDYYRLFAYLNGDHEANIVVYTPEEEAQRQSIFRRVDAIENGLRERHPKWRQRMAEWEAQAQVDSTEWVVVHPKIVEVSSGGQRFLPQEDGSLLAQGYSPVKNQPEFIVTTDVENIAAIRFELFTHPNLPLSGPGRSIYGTAALSEFQVEAAPLSAPDRGVKVEWAGATSDLELPEAPLDALFDNRTDVRRVTGPPRYAIDGKVETAWGTDAGPGRRNEARQAVFKLKSPMAHQGGSRLRIVLLHRHGGWNNNDNQNHNVGRFRISVTSDVDATADPLPRRVRQILGRPAATRSAAEEAAVFSYWRTTVPQWRAENERIEELWKQHPEGTSQLVLQARDRPRPTSVLERGDFLKPTRLVSAGTPSFLHTLDNDAPPSRLTFAKWLVDRRAPTTARSFVNRVWQTYFGRGLVATSEDLGTQSESPTHPDLLDWLAVEFMESGWSIKRLHRLIVTSATYRQSSRVTPELHERDPDNRWLGRGARLRVEGEVVRDIALAASGLLKRKLGGRSVYPPLPEFLLKPPVSFGTKTWHVETGSERYRRALYTFRFRSVPYPMLETFDAPNGDASCVRRTRSNTPLQALTTLNEPLFLECARALAQRALEAEAEDDAARVTFAFRTCVSRHPTAAEKGVLLDLLAAEHAERQPSDASAVELAAWTAVARVILNLDETITKE